MGTDKQGHVVAVRGGNFVGEVFTQQSDFPALFEVHQRQAAVDFVEGVLHVGFVAILRGVVLVGVV